MTGKRQNTHLDNARQTFADDLLSVHRNNENAQILNASLRPLSNRDPTRRVPEKFGPPNYNKRRSCKNHSGKYESGRIFCTSGKQSDDMSDRSDLAMHCQLLPAFQQGSYV